MSDLPKEGDGLGRTKWREAVKRSRKFVYYACQRCKRVAEPEVMRQPGGLVIMMLPGKNFKTCQRCGGALERRAKHDKGKDRKKKP